jgi:ribosomal protein L33
MFLSKEDMLRLFCSLEQVLVDKIVTSFVSTAYTSYVNATVLNSRLEKEKFSFLRKKHVVLKEHPNNNIEYNNIACIMLPLTRDMEKIATLDNTDQLEFMREICQKFTYYRGFA